MPNISLSDFLGVMAVGSSLCLSMMLNAPARSQPSRDDDRLPILYGVKLDGSQIAIDVVSSGCTDESYFSVELDPVSPGTYRLSVLQNKQDRCRMGTHIVTLTLDIPIVQDPAGTNFILVNRLAIPVVLLRPDP
jgi:hypothetical protein